ncbi:MAG TPA: type II toxin-antitoxin system RelE/ParE family toxin [Nitrososphaerales archaeon]
MRFQILLHPKAAEDLAKIQTSVRDTIKKALNELEDSPEGKGEQLKPSDFWRIRVGNYKAIYKIDRKRRIIIILYLGHRKSVYDEFSRLL